MKKQRQKISGQGGAGRGQGRKPSAEGAAEKMSISLPADLAAKLGRYMQAEGLRYRSEAVAAIIRKLPEP